MTRPADDNDIVPEWWFPYSGPREGRIVLVIFIAMWETLGIAFWNAVPWWATLIITPIVMMFLWFAPHRDLDRRRAERKQRAEGRK